MKSICEKPKLAAETRMVDDGSGEVGLIDVQRMVQPSSLITAIEFIYTCTLITPFFHLNNLYNEYLRFVAG